VSAVGVDTGGTFTDVVARTHGGLVTLKVASTPSEPHRATLEGLSRVGAKSGTRVRYGSTLATNTLLERSGARVTLVTTEGFEDVIEIGRQDRPDIYSLSPRRVPPLVPAERRIGARERRGPHGERWQALTPAEIARVVRRVRRTGPEAIAIGLLHAYADASHERRLARALKTLGVPVTTSSDLCPEIREVERLATTVTNAYIEPRVHANLTRIARGTRARVEVVLSHGGTAPIARAAREPVRQLLSGPAAGLRAARDVARACGYAQALTIDVGGTSTDCAYVHGELPRRRAREVAGFPVLLPLLDVHTIGAGGGSIARVDAGGLLHVGPQSAGASPGPACYGRGGPPTLTDALVTLGRIPGETIAGGAQRLDRRAAAAAMAGIARWLGVRGVTAAAEGVVRVAEASMAAALRRVSVERGHDPRSAALVAFGGAGGLHACALADAIGCRAVLFPRHAGLLSAIGALTGGPRRERGRSLLVDVRDTHAIAASLARLERELLAEFDRDERREVRIERWAELRYRGQAHELSLPVDASLTGRFHRAHRDRFGFDDPTAPIEVVTLEVRGSLPDQPLPARLLAGPRSVQSRATRMTMHHDGRDVGAAVWNRPGMPRGARLRGPAIVLEEGATLWIPPGWNGRLHASGAVVLTRSGAGR
jgi:N-methylhydantoinase A